MRPAPGLPIEQQPPGVVARLALCGEARGEQDAAGTLEAIAMAAVYWVGLNRIALRRNRGKSIGDVFLEPWQFSCFNTNDPNRAKLLDLWKTDPVSWERADTVADLAERGLLHDPTFGSTHYCTANLWGLPTPEGAAVQWFHASEIQAGRTKEKARIGGHVFGVAP